MSVTWKIECTDGKKEPVILGVGRTVIGRGHLLQIRELKVSRHHAEVQITDGDEFILKAMHPGLPCYYKRKGDKAPSDLLRGATVKLDHGDTFSLHSNPDCEFRVISSSAENNGTDEPDSGDENQPSSTVKDDEVTKKEASADASDEAKDEEEEDEEEPEDDGSDWSESEQKKKSKTSRTKKQRGVGKGRSSRKPPPPKKKKVASSDEEDDFSEEESEGNESEESDYAGRRSRRQPARSQPRLPSRRATKPISYNEDLLIDGLSPSEQEEESDDGLPKIGRQKKDSDSDFQVDEDSDSDWEENKPSRKSKGNPPTRKGGRRRKGSESEFSDEEPEYMPRPSRRRSAPASRNRGEYYRKNSDHKEDTIHPGDSDWSDASQEEKESGEDKEDEGDGSE